MAVCFAVGASGCSKSSSADADAGPGDSRDSGGGGESGGGAGSGAPGDGGAAVSCNPSLANVVDWKDPETAATARAFTWAGGHVAAVWNLEGARGYRVLDLDPSGAQAARFGTLWTNSFGSGEGVRVAASPSVLAVVERRVDQIPQRLTCHFALARLDPIESIRPFERFSDEPETASVWNEAAMCDVAPLGDGFLLLWQQVATRQDGTTKLLAQRIGPDGSLRGERLTLREGLVKPVPFDTMASDGTRVAVAIPAERDSQDASLAFIGIDSFVTAPLVLMEGGKKATSLQLRAAHGGYLARTADSVWLLDAKGHATGGPKKLSTTSSWQAFLGPFEDGYAVVDHGEYLVATSRDARLESQSAPLGLSVDRGAHAQALLGDADGETTLIAFSDQNGDHIATLACSEEPPGSPGSSTCPKQTSPTPLADGCSDPVCHVVLRFDYLTLGLRGWAVVGGKPRSVSASEALQIASDTFKANSDYIRREPEIQEAAASLYYVYASPSDYGGFALVSAPSGVVVAAGGVVWSGTDKLWVPATWNDPGNLACGDSAATPMEVMKVGGTDCRREDRQQPASVDEALDTALRTNLAASVAARGPFDAYAYLYMPSVGGCDPDTAEYLVVLSQERP